MDDVVLAKAAIIERCVVRARAVYGGDALALETDLLRQDSVVLNVQRACKASIDLAMHLVRIRRLGAPQQSRDAFELLVRANLLEQSVGESLKRMVGFRNIAVHDYTRLDLAILRAILERELDELLRFSAHALRGLGTDHTETR